MCVRGDDSYLVVVVRGAIIHESKIVEVWLGFGEEGVVNLQLKSFCVSLCKLETAILAARMA